MIITLCYIVIGLMASFSLLMMVRNQWVYEHRKRLIDAEYKHRLSLLRNQDIEVFKALPNSFLYQYLSYNQMMCRFWVWNIEKLRK